jgi:hypothetical protein
MDTRGMIMAIIRAQDAQRTDRNIVSTIIYVANRNINP